MDDGCARKDSVDMTDCVQGKGEYDEHLKYGEWDKFGVVGNLINSQDMTDVPNYKMHENVRLQLTTQGKRKRKRKWWMYKERRNILISGLNRSFEIRILFVVTWLL